MSQIAAPLAHTERRERERDKETETGRETERQTRNTHHHLHTTNEHVQTTRLQYIPIMHICRLP